MKRMHLCSNCLKNYKGTCHINLKCNMCNKNHHSVLHLVEKFAKTSNEVAGSSQQVYEPLLIKKSNKNSSVNSTDSVSVVRHVASEGFVWSLSSDNIMLMATAVVDVTVQIKSILCRVLLDNASEKNFVSSNVISQLDAQTSPGS